MIPTSILVAQQQAAAGMIDQAVRTLQAAGAAGDTASYVELAAWYLAGMVVRRDLASARTLLRRAAALGHPEAAMMEVALTANGSGASSNWAEAVALLKTAARSNPIASEHLTLLAAMSIDADGTAQHLHQPAVLSHTPFVARIPSFCTAAECLHIGLSAAHLLQPATVFDPSSGRIVPHPVRQSDNASIGPTIESLPIQAINRRIAAATQTHVMQGEPLTILRYSVGQQYKPHLDTLPNGDNQRILTAILYLNDGYQGGETQFPRLGLSIAPRTGDLLIFANVRPDGMPESLSTHAGLPVTDGLKWIATRWIRMRQVTAWELSDQTRAGTPSA